MTTFEAELEWCLVGSEELVTDAPGTSACKAAAVTEVVGVDLEEPVAGAAVTEPTAAVSSTPAVIVGLSDASMPVSVSPRLAALVDVVAPTASPPYLVLQEHIIPAVSMGDAPLEIQEVRESSGGGPFSSSEQLVEPLQDGA